tara:strand:+ start:252 stop:356 length:105 start_codon:yes stop_codon:yes gene_type:complete
MMTVIHKGIFTQQKKTVVYILDASAIKKGDKFLS